MNVDTVLRYFNALKDYEGEDRVYPYSIQHVMVTEEVRAAVISNILFNKTT